jgi:hypothetical protein
MSKRASVQKRINQSHLSKNKNQLEKYRRIQMQFKERSSMRYEGKRVRTDDVISELSAEWCLSVARIEQILRLTL